ncbi:MAG: SDR family NAD(P)-dependent oxidoreductase [Phyllobacterium sp.]
MGKFSNKTVLVTGANGGIGTAIAKHLGEEGANLIVSDLRLDALGDVFDQFRDRVLGLSCDVTDWVATQTLLSAAVSRFERIDAAVLNAGIEGIFAPIGEASLEDFNRVLDINLKGVFIGLSHLMPLMKAQGTGAIVILSSTGGLRGSAGLSAYTASKHGVIGLMKSAALEGASHKVRVNTVNPGPINTRMIHSIEQSRNNGRAEGERQSIADLLPLRRLGEPDEVAKFIGFLCSDDAQFCTGQTYVIDGGSMAGR